MKLLAVVVLALITIGVVVINIVMRVKGYAIPGKTVVRCSRGHIFRTIWIEGGSLKAVRLGPRTRFQYCPIGKHWAIIHPIKEQDLTPADQKILSQQNTG